MSLENLGRQSFIIMIVTHSYCNIVCMRIKCILYFIQIMNVLRYPTTKRYEQCEYDGHWPWSNV